MDPPLSPTCPRSGPWWVLPLLLGGCSGDSGGGGEAGTATSVTTTAASATDGTGATGTGATATDGGTSGAATSGGSTGTGGGAKFDVPGGTGGGFPTACEDAADGETTVGCVFHAVDLEQAGIFENVQFAVVVSNVQPAQVASVRVEQKQAGSWMTVDGPVMVDPLDLHIFPLANHVQIGSGLKVGGSYRVVSDIPIIAYQFNPLEADVWSSDASLLYPTSAWDTLAHVVQWGDGADGDHAYVVVTAAEDATLVTVRPSVATSGGTGVPAGQPGVEFNMLLNAGDIAHVAAANQNDSLTGTRIEADRPIGVFSGHSCAFIPEGVYACDHLEEQLAGVRLWGKRFSAARMPARTPNAPEGNLWQIYASEDGTTVTFDAPAGVTGLPASPSMLDAGQHLAFYTAGPSAAPGDFLVEADRPIALMSYMTGWENLVGLETGDPAMLQLGPVEQFLDRYVVLVPNKWDNDYLVITRTAGASVTIDGVEADPNQFIDAGGGYEVGRILTPDGVHELAGSGTFGVAVVGYDYADSYAYLGGIGTGQINPTPEG